MKKIDTIKNSNGENVSFKDFKEEYYNFKGATNYILKARNSLIKRLESLQNDPIQEYNKIEFLKIIIKDFKSIVTALPSEIDILIAQIERKRMNFFGDNEDEHREFYMSLLSDFNYKDFRSSSQLEWFGKCFKIKACLYCNSQFTIIVDNNKNKKSKLLFQIDHFYNKDRYPYLSLTLGNLVPSCSSCNIRKGKSDFNLTNNIHPFIEDLNSYFEFKVNESKILDNILSGGNFKDIKPTWDIKSNYVGAEKQRLEDRVTTHFDAFNLQNIYNVHSDIVEELIMKGLHYNDSHRNELINTFNELDIDKGLIDRFILGNYTLDEEINLRPLSKLSKDIAKQLKLIK